MDPALLVLGLLPPPAPGARVLAGAHRAAAGLAADRAVALVVEGVVRDAVHAQVVPHRLFGPGGERVEFLQAVPGVVGTPFGTYLDEIMAGWYGLDMDGLSALNWIDYYVIPAPGAGPGMCQSPEQIPQGPPIVSTVQPRVIAM